MKVLTKWPDCEVPRLTDQEIPPANGLGVPMSSCSSYLKNDATSRNAAKPIPSTYGSLAVKITLYASAGSNPFFMQICAGSSVPGKGFVALQLAHAQSVLGTVAAPVTAPSTLSDVWVTMVVCVVSRLAGLYGTGFA